MKAAVVLVTLALALIVEAKPQFQPSQRLEAEPPLFRSEQRDDYGQYSLSYLTKGGLRVIEQARLKPIQDGPETKYVLVKQGEFQYTGSDGVPVLLKYVADENGFQPTGDHLPVAPAAPEPTQ